MAPLAPSITVIRNLNQARIAPGVMSVKPGWVWDEGEVRGHVFLCVMGRMLYRRLQWRGCSTGISLKRMVAEMDRIRLGVVKTVQGKLEQVVEEMNGWRSRLFSRLRLGDLISL